MKNTFLYLGIGIFAFLIGLGVVSYFAFRPSYDLQISKNICQECLDISKNENLETKNLCEIINDERFYGKKVRLRATFGHDAGHIFFSESKESSRTVQASFDKTTINCSDTEKTLRVCTGYKSWYDSSVDVIVIGYLSKIDKKDYQSPSFDTVFNIVCIEQVIASDEDLLNSKRKFESSFFNFIELFISK